MARSRSPSSKFWERHPGVYARTSDTWSTRYYHRKQDPIFDMLGLCTVPDVMHKKDGSSPFLRNVRYMGEREENQRAQVMSRKGAKRLGSIGESSIAYPQSEATSYLEIKQGKAIQWPLTHNRRLTGINLWLNNIERATGFMKITIRDANTQAEITNAVIDCDSIATLGYSLHEVYFIRSVLDSRLLVRVEIMDDVYNDELGNDELAQRGVRILAHNISGHEWAEYDVPNTNEALREVPFDFKPGATAPMTGTVISSWEPMLRSKEFVSGGREYVIFPVRRDGVVELYRADKATGAIAFVTSLVSDDAKAVRFAQAGGYLYYVDGISPLRRINLTTWAAEDAVPLQSEITVEGVDPNTLKAKEGASLIHWMDNRLYLSGFEDDPNLVLISLIDNVKPRYDQYNDRFYSPDQDPQMSAANPITALADQSGYLIVFRLNDLSIYDRGSSTVMADATQVTPEGASLGVLNQEAVCQGKNNIYFYNAANGVQRFGGSVTRTVSQDIDNLIRRIKHKDSIFMLYANDKLHMFFSFDSKTPDSRFFYYPELASNLPWYMDDNTPISSAVAFNSESDIYAIHSEVATFMQMDTQFTDFDSYIELEYHTQYRLPPTADPNGFVYVNRLHLHEISNSTHSVFLALDLDHQDSPIVWRKYTVADTKPELNPDAVFQHTAEPGTTVFSIPMYTKCRRYQVRIKRYCYKDSSEILGAYVEYDTQRTL